MKRFYGSAVFEGEEVSDSALIKLQDIRSEEQHRVEYHKTEFRMQIDELDFWRNDEIATINSEAQSRTNEQNREIHHCYSRISRIVDDANYRIHAIRADYFLQYKVHGSQQENDAVAAVLSSVRSQIYEQNSIILSCHREINYIEFTRKQNTVSVHSAYKTEYDIRLRRRDKDIAWTHADASDKIAAVFANRYILPVFMLRCAKGPCEYCRAKYGTTGTRDQLEKVDCIPPFHDDCRCWHEEVGYVVMSH